MVTKTTHCCLHHHAPVSCLLPVLFWTSSNFDSAVWVHSFLLKVCFFFWCFELLHLFCPSCPSFSAAPWLVSPGSRYLVSLAFLSPSSLLCLTFSEVLVVNWFFKTGADLLCFGLCCLFTWFYPLPASYLWVFLVFLMFSLGFLSVTTQRYCQMLLLTVTVKNSRVLGEWTLRKYDQICHLRSCNFLLYFGKVFLFE